MAPKRKKAATSEAPPTKSAPKKRLKAQKSDIRSFLTSNSATPSPYAMASAPSENVTSSLTAESWREVLESEFSQDYFKDLEKQLQDDYSAGKIIFPPRHLIFNAFNLTPLDKILVVIIGQDPYHDDGQAHGLSFSVPRGIKTPPSLKNIYKELSDSIDGFTAPSHGCLECWAQRGVFMLNATLTVEAHKANSHAKYGWQKFTDHVIKTISDKREGVAFVLWGKFAHKKAELVDETKHTVIKTAHPSPLSVKAFMGCGCFSECDKALKGYGRTPIDWNLD